MVSEDRIHEESESQRTTLGNLARKVLLAGVGAAALAQEEVEAFVKKLIEKGELSESDGRVLIKDLRDKRRKRVEEVIDRRIVTILERLKVPTKSDYETLTEKITELTKKLDDL